MGAKLGRRRALRLAGGVAGSSIVEGLLPAALRAQAPAEDGVVGISLRLRTIEALPIYVARRTGAEQEVGITVRLNNASGEDNPVSGLGARSVAAFATSYDYLVAGQPAVVDLFNAYDRAPVALVADASEGTAGLVVAARHDPSLVGALRHDLARRPDSPRFVAGGGWFGVAANYEVGEVDGVFSQAPLPQYLALGKGRVIWDASVDQAIMPIGAGSLVATADLNENVRVRLVALVRRGVEVLRSERAEDLAELVFDDYPIWEPDAVLEAVRVAKRCLNAHLDGRLTAAALATAARVAEVAVTPEDAARLGAVPQ
jgi:hypothetical protein